MDIKKETKAALEYLQAGNVREAEHIFRNILKVQPNNVSALHFVGVICYQRKEYDLAITYIKKALQFGPDYIDAYNNLGSVLQEIGRFDEAVACYKKALELNPRFVRAYNNLANAFKEKWQLDEAILNYRKAIQLSPDLAEPYNGLANALQDQGKLEEAEECYRHALKLKPLFTYYDNLLMMMNYGSRHEAGAVFSDHLKFAQQFEAPLALAIVPHRNDCSSARRLRIGYVSPDFRRHSVNYFIEPVLASHNRDRFEVFCYSDVLRPDNVTERMQSYVDHWHDIKGIPDEKAAELIRKDGIDILVDLAGHTANNRLLLFARKPAPVQVSWIGYPNTTGLSTIDYRVVDSYTDPPGLTDPFYTEKLVRLPESFLCYLPDKDSPAVGDLPAMKSGYVTFGSFNYFPKVSPEAAELWAKILKAVAGSRLILKTRNFADSATRQYAIEMFIRQGVATERIELLSMKTSVEEHLNTYNRIDIALDTFPYNGTTTTFEALWMGVPVITFAGNIHASRVGKSLLTNMGLPELVSGTFEEYVSIAVNLAYDLKRLQAFREGLRDKMSHSPLTDAKRFIVNLETCYRTMWEQRCNISHSP
jgi:predicted O-linked N-acetylglucosamine transferase (SPINDLY family)